MEKEIEKGDTIVTRIEGSWVELHGKSEHLIDVLDVREENLIVTMRGDITPAPNIYYPERWQVVNDRFKMLHSGTEGAEVLRIEKGAALEIVSSYKKYLESVEKLEELGDSYVKNFRKDHECHIDMSAYLINKLTNTEMRALGVLEKVDEKARAKKQLVKDMIFDYYLQRRGICGRTDPFELLDDLAESDKVTRDKLLGRIIIDNSIQLLEKVA